MKQNLYRDEIKRILILYGMSFIILSSLLIYIFLVTYSNYNIKEKNNRSNKEVSEFISSELTNYGDKINELEKSPIIKDFVINGDHQSEVYSLLYQFNNSSKMRGIFYIVNTNGETTLTNNYVESPYNDIDIFTSGLFKQLKSRPNKVVFMNNKVQIDLTKRTIYSIGKAIIIDGEIKGYLIFDILESDWSKRVHHSDVDIIVVTDQYKNIVITTNTLIADDIGKFTLIKNAKDKISFLDKEYYFQQSAVMNNQIYVYTLSDLQFISSLINVSIFYFVIILLVLFIIITIAAKYVSNKKTKSIELLIDSINKVQKGDLKAYVKMNTNDEFELIGNQFNKMLIDLNEQLERNNELIDRNRLSEIKQLEAQFNPHFIFNTLESLKYMISIDEKKSVNIIMSLAKILRYSIDYQQKKITLEEDLDYLNSYLMIQKYRFNKRLNYLIKVEEEAKKCIVPKLIMQPIVENCINHGYVSKDVLHIHIDIRTNEKCLVMVIEDDGDGISKEKMNDIIENLENTTTHSSSIGLNNVFRRIKLMYGNEYGMTIKSEEDKGTRIIIYIPIEEW